MRTVRLCANYIGTISVNHVLLDIVERGMFVNADMGTLVPISGSDPVRGNWEHIAFVPSPLPEDHVNLEPETYLAIANARAALASLDSTARRLPNPRLLRQSTLRLEAQSTSALEGTFAPLEQVLAVSEEDIPTGDLREIFNYVGVAEAAFAGVEEGRPLSVTWLSELQGQLVAGTASETSSSGRVRDVQVLIGKRIDDPITAARFVPMPPTSDLTARLRDLLDWAEATSANTIDPVIAAAMTHYQFETLHPFNDGNGRIGRLMIVLQLQAAGALTEPTLTVSPWFESRRQEYYDSLLGVSTRGDWEKWIRFFAEGIAASATATQAQMDRLVDVQEHLHSVVRASPLRADSAHALVDLAIGRITFSARNVEHSLNISYGRANGLINQLVGIGVLTPLRADVTYQRRFYAPDVMSVLLNRG